MKKWIMALASAALALALAACEGQPELWNAGTYAEETVEKAAAAAWRDGDSAVYARGGVELPVPLEYGELVELEFPEEGGHWRTLFTCREKASLDAGARSHPGEDMGDGWIFSIARLDQIAFEEWLTEEEGGSYLFARDETGGYYLYTYPIDVRFHRPEGDAEGAGSWTELDEWGATVPDALVARNAALREYDVFSLYRRESLYDGAHATVLYERGESAENPVYFRLAQPVRQGTGGVWCVERVEYEYTEDGWTDTHLVFPAGYGVEMTAEDYYVRLQEECDAGGHAELLTPMGAALAFTRAGGCAISGAREQDFVLFPTL